MNDKKLKKGIVVFLVFFVSVFLSAKINILEKSLEDFFFYQIIEKNPSVLSAEITSNILLKPKRNPKIPELKLEAKSAISIYVNPQGKERILFQKQAFKELPIASLTKLMSASVALDVYRPEQKLKISPTAVAQPEERGKLKPGDILTVKDLVYIMLLESSNDAAQALAEGKGESEFVALMNKKAESLKMKNTYFSNPSGLDPNNRETPNLSTAKDLAKLIKYLIFKQPQVLEITKTLSYEVREENGFHHFIGRNTNKLLQEIPEIIGGKTGYTEKAGGCIIIVLKAPRPGYIINVVLGSKSYETRFQEMKKIINWINNAYIW